MAAGLACALCVLAVGLAPEVAGAAASWRGPGGSRATASPAGVIRLQSVADTLLGTARGLLARGLSVPAARLLARGLSRGDVAGPDAVLLAARAHAAHGDWAAVRRLLLGQPWLERARVLEGRRLLARALLETGDPGGAADEYARYLAVEPDVDDRSGAGRLEALVRRARALAASGRPAEAVESLDEAAGLAPGIAPWLELAALQVMASAEPASREEAWWAEGDRRAAALLERESLPADSIFAIRARLAFLREDTTAALEHYRRAGQAAAPLAGPRVAPARLARADTAGAADAYREALRSGSPPAHLVPALLALDSGWNARVEAATSDLGAGRGERGIRLLREALERAPSSERPAVARRLARALRASGDPAAALAVLEPWLEAPGLSPEERGELWLEAAGARTELGRPEDAERALRVAATGEGDDAAFAGYLLADRLHDAGDHDGAREAYAANQERFPGTRFGERSLVRLGLLDFLEGNHGRAETHFEAYGRRYPRGDWAVGAVYWRGRTALARGDTVLARRRFEAVMARDPLGYYGMLAGRRLDRDPWTSLEAAGGAPRDPGPEARALLDRMERLRSLGWTARARAEYRSAGLSGSDDTRRLLGLALALDSAGWTTEGVAAAWRVRARGGGWTPSLLRAVYPLPYAEPLVHAAGERDLAPALVAGLVRRESLFDPEAVSSAAAVGLMQLLPATALDVTDAAGLPDFRLPQLTDPEINLLLGTTYLADLLDRFDGSRTAALIGYNAGPHRYRAWRSFPERAADPELFVERIPFRETREYVRAVRALAWIYARLYGLGDPAATSGDGAEDTVDASEGGE